MKVSAIIFDLDGTVIDDEDEWGEAFGNVLKKLGAKNVPKYPHIGGIGLEENWPILLKKYDLETKFTLDELTSFTTLEYEKLIPRITLKEGFSAFVKDLRDSNITTALATSSYWKSVEKIYDSLGIEKDFDYTTTGDEVKFKKPDPEVFIITAEKMGVEPKDCIVIEDSAAGIEAAHSAGMKAIAIARDKSQLKNLKIADLIVENFSQITVDKISSL